MTIPSAPSLAAPQHILCGIALRLFAMAGASIMFVLVKYVAEAGIHVVESLFWRQALALPFVFAWVVMHGGVASLKTRRIGAHTRRMLLGLAGMGANFAAMIFLPMAEATTISLSVPIFATIFAAILLGEQTGRARWSAVVFGFVGVLVVLAPGAEGIGGFSGEHGLGTLVALGGAIMTGLITIQVRDLGRTESATTIVFWFSLLSLVPLGIAMPFVFQSHSVSEWLMLLGLGFSGAVVQLALTGALRLAPVAVVIPMDYSSLLWSIVCGWWFFGTLPAETTWLGAPIIVARGLFIAWREHRRAIDRAKEVVL